MKLQVKPTSFPRIKYPPDMYNYEIALRAGKLSAVQLLRMHIFTENISNLEFIILCPSTSTVMNIGGNARYNYNLAIRFPSPVRHWKREGTRVNYFFRSCKIVRL